MAKIIAEMIAEGHFDSNSGKIRSVLVDDILLSSSDGAPKTYLMPITITVVWPEAFGRLCILSTFHSLENNTAA